MLVLKSFITKVIRLFQVNDLIDLIIQCAKSAIFETRKLAARALVPLLTTQSVQYVLTKIIENIISAGTNYSSLNLIHGYMLQVCISVMNISLKY